MSAPLLPPATRPEFNGSELHYPVNALRAVDNVRNWFYLTREYVFLAAVLGLTIAFYHFRADWGLAWAWNVPVTVLAVLLVGAGQHRLAALGHEASHYLLFRNRRLNEWAADWLCMFPLFSTTHRYRLLHMAHHKFVNDPQRDPDLAHLQASGFLLSSPLAPRRFIWRYVGKPLLWMPSLWQHTRILARNINHAGEIGPYKDLRPGSRLLAAFDTGCLGVLLTLYLIFEFLHVSWILGPAPWGLLAVLCALCALAPARLFPVPAIKPDVSIRTTTVSRMIHWTLLFTGAAWLESWTGGVGGAYLLVLWAVPLYTSFAFYAILREVAHHGNVGEERLGSTRVLHVGGLIRFAVFPYGLDYHLPHHLFPLVPHYRLRKLHALLMTSPAYRREATVVEGYFFPRGTPPGPTVLDVAGRRRPGFPVVSESA